MGRTVPVTIFIDEDCEIVEIKARPIASRLAKPLQPLDADVEFQDLTGSGTLKGTLKETGADGEIDGGVDI